MDKYKQSDSFAKTTIEPTQTKRGKPVLDIPKSGFLKLASAAKRTENIVANLLFCDDFERETVKPIIRPRQNRFNNIYWIVKDREDFQREAFGQRIINVTNGTRFYFDHEQNCSVYESWVTIPTIDRQKVLGLNTTSLEEDQWIGHNLGLPWEPTTPQNSTPPTDNAEKYKEFFAQKLKDAQNLPKTLPGVQGGETPKQQNDGITDSNTQVQGQIQSTISDDEEV
jgi:hypothetical protein